MSALEIHVDGVGLFGPGLAGWAHASEVLRDKAALRLAPTQLPAAEALPAAERRRVGLSVKLALAVGFEAVHNAGADPAHLATTFSSSASDCDNCHGILQTLASDDRAVSPTRFHNSVHNAPAGYWSIATACMEPSTSLCAYDATFAAGLLEAATLARASGRPCLLLAFDTAYPEPLHTLRPIPYALGVALVLNPVKTAAARALLAIDFTHNAATPMSDADLEALRVSIPAARSLPLLQCMARDERACVVIDYFDDLNLAIGVQQ